VVSTATVLLNYQGDPRCSGDGLLFVTPQGGSPAPSLTPSATPSYALKSPTPLPTLAPTFNGFFQVIPANAQAFVFTGTPQTYVVPANVNALRVDACGARGGWDAGTNTGFGGYVSAIIPATPGSTLFVYVGQFGYRGNYNGGGTGNTVALSGGGGTDIRSANGGASGSQNLGSRLVVAGGGGAGGGWGYWGGAGGGLVGQTGAGNGGYGNSIDEVGTGGTQDHITECNHSLDKYYLRTTWN
jgi:hypothetical protein